MAHCGQVLLRGTIHRPRQVYKVWFCIELVNIPTSEIDFRREHSFEALVVLLREKPIIAVSKACLQRIHLLSTFRHGSPSNAVTPESVNVRVFLAASMIAYRPTHVFESMGALEQALYQSANPLLTTFERICSCIRSSPGRCFREVPHELTKDFAGMLFEYLERFKAWKVPDDAKLTCRIRHALVALYQAQERLPPDEPDDSKLSIEFRTQIERLRTKLRQIAGEDALSQLDGQRRAGLVPKGDRGGLGGGGPGGAGGAGGAYAALPGRMNSEQLAHELLLDPGFQLDESGGCGAENPVFDRIRESFHQAFWDSLVDDLRLAAPCYARVLRVLAEIRDGISELAGPWESESIREAVDLDFIRQQVAAGLYGWDSCTGLVAGVVAVIQRVQAPGRDAETRAKWTEVGAAMRGAAAEERPRALCKGLALLLERVNAMRIDAANARLRLVAPVVRDHGVDYERGKFQDRLDDGTLTLERTEVAQRARRGSVGCKGRVEFGEAAAARCASACFLFVLSDREAHLCAFSPNLRFVAVRGAGLDPAGGAERGRERVGGAGGPAGGPGVVVCARALRGIAGAGDGAGARRARRLPGDAAA